MKFTGHINLFTMPEHICNIRCYENSNVMKFINISTMDP